MQLYINHASLSCPAQFPKHVACVCHDLQFSQPWKCSSAVTSVVSCALPDGTLRVQEHAPGSALIDSSCVRQHLFHRYQRGHIGRHLPKVSILI